MNPISTRRIVAAGTIGNLLEWYDFAVYGYFAAAIGRAFFPSEDPVAIYYEVDQLGRVSRLIDVFAGGGKDRSALADFGVREGELPGEASLVEGSFHEAAANLIAGHVIALRPASGSTRGRAAVIQTAVS